MTKSRVGQWARCFHNSQSKFWRKWKKVIYIGFPSINFVKQIQNSYLQFINSFDEQNFNAFCSFICNCHTGFFHNPCDDAPDNVILFCWQLKHDSIVSILNDHLGETKLSARWVLWLFTKDHKKLWYDYFKRTFEVVQTTIRTSLCTMFKPWPDHFSQHIGEKAAFLQANSIERSNNSIWKWL